MNKMNYQEILEKLKEFYPNGVEDFAYEEQSYDFENYPEALEAQKVRKEFRKLHLIDNKWDNVENPKIYSELPDEYEVIKKLSRKKAGLNWVEVDKYGGEGKGSTWYSIKYFIDYDIYIKVDGYYQSYNGTEFYDGWDSCSQVFPKQKTITVYEQL